jgi:CRISPR-associated protein Cas2
LKEQPGKYYIRILIEGKLTVSKLERLNQYQILWIFVFFDLPTETKQDRKNYAQFRKNLQKDGFTMMQYSIYVRHCSSRENADVHIKRVKSFLAPKGEIIIFSLTDKQFGMMEFFRSQKEIVKPGTPQQLELF